MGEDPGRLTNKTAVFPPEIWMDQNVQRAIDELIPPNPFRSSLQIPLYLRGFRIPEIPYYALPIPSRLSDRIGTWKTLDYQGPTTICSIPKASSSVVAQKVQLGVEVRAPVLEHSRPTNLVLLRTGKSSQNPDVRTINMSVDKFANPLLLDFEAMMQATKPTLLLNGPSTVKLYDLARRKNLAKNRLESFGTNTLTGRITEDPQNHILKHYFSDSTKDSAVSFKLKFTPPHCQWTNRLSYGNSRNKLQDDGSNLRSTAWGISCDQLTNRLYFTDRKSHTLTCLDQEGEVLFTHVGSPTFSRPTGICCDHVNRRVLVADKDNHRISFFSMDCQYISSFGFVGDANENGSLNFPWDVAVSPKGDRIAVTDSGNKRIQLFDKDGNYVSKSSCYETKPLEYKRLFKYPRGVTFNNEGTAIFVTDFKSNKIVEVLVDDLSTHRDFLPNPQLSRPQGIVVDELRNLLVCDSNNQCVRHLCTRTGHSFPQIQSVAYERLDFPVNLTLMMDGRLAVLDSEGMVRIF